MENIGFSEVQSDEKFLMKSNTFLLLIYIILIYTNFVISMIIAYQVQIGVLHSYKKSY